MSAAESSRKFSVSEAQKKMFAGIYMLETMAFKKEQFDVFLQGNHVDLEPVFEWLMMHEFLDINKENRYEVTADGHALLQRFGHRYKDFLRHFDVYSAVDLAEGSFGLSHYFEWEHTGKGEDAWRAFLCEERWEDLRLAVAHYKGIEPIEVVFMSFLREKRFGFSETSGWQFDLLLGTVWDEMVRVANSALLAKDLGYTDEETHEVISGKSVIEDVIIEGASVNLSLFMEEGDRDNTHNGFCNNIRDMHDKLVQTYAAYKEDTAHVSSCWKKPLIGRKGD